MFSNTGKAKKVSLAKNLIREGVHIFWLKSGLFANFHRLSTKKNETENCKS